MLFLFHIHCHLRFLKKILRNSFREKNIDILAAECISVICFLIEVRKGVVSGDGW